MQFKIGDKIKFLNQNGGGIITKILSPQMVSVSIEDGFEIPTLISEILKIEMNSNASSLFRDDTLFENIKAAVDEEENEELEYERVFPLKKMYTNLNRNEGVYLAFVPHEQRWLLTGKLDVFLLNNTPYDLIFSLFLRDIETEDFYGQDYDVLPKQSKLLLATISRDEINNWSKGTIQALFHSNKSKFVLNPLSSEFKIKEMRFLKEENYKNISIIDEKAFVVTLLNLAEATYFIENKKDLTVEEVKIQPKTKILTNDFAGLDKLDSKTAEIDLHIESLTEESALLSPIEMLQIQMRHFEKSLNAAIENHLQQITFIHGVGSGTLKTEIIQTLKQYEGLHWFDAPMSKYGVGATQVFIGENVKQNT